MTDAVPAAALEAATWALHSRPHGTINGPCACDSADEHGCFLAEDETAAKLALEVAAPHIAAAWTRIEPDPDAPGYNRGVFDVSGFATEVLAPAERERIRTEAAAAERERIRQRMLGCVTCGKIHQRRPRPPDPRHPEEEPGVTWASTDDGHSYRPRWRDAALITEAIDDLLDAP